MIENFVTDTIKSVITKKGMLSCQSFRILLTYWSCSICCGSWSKNAQLHNLHSREEHLAFAIICERGTCIIITKCIKIENCSYHSDVQFLFSLLS